MKVSTCVETFGAGTLAPSGGEKVSNCFDYLGDDFYSIYRSGIIFIVFIVFIVGEAFYRFYRSEILLSFYCSDGRRGGGG